MNAPADQQAWLPVAEALEAAWQQAQQKAEIEDAMMGLAMFAALAVRNACDGDLEKAVAAFTEEVAAHAKAMFHPDGRPRPDFIEPSVN
jgi:hypothetical protein